MTSYGYTIDLMEFQAEALKRILKNAIRDAKKVEPESRESALKHVDAVVDQKIIEKLWDCGRNYG